MKRKSLSDIVRKKGLYDYEHLTVKRYSENHTRLIYQPVHRTSGLETDITPKCSVNSHKLANNIVRARSKVCEYILCNPFTYFVTLTISQQKYDRYNLKAFYADFAKFINNYNRYCDDNEKIKYILIPEMHKDGAWHFHGVMSGIRSNDLILNQNGYLDWKSYSEKFGYISLSKIKDKSKISSYMQKYLTKDMSRAVQELGYHTYYASKGLKTAEVIFSGSAYALKENIEWDYEHPAGYCKIKTIDEVVTPLESIINYDYNKRRT